MVELPAVECTLQDRVEIKQKTILRAIKLRNLTTLNKLDCLDMSPEKTKAKVKVQKTSRKKALTIKKKEEVFLKVMQFQLMIEITKL